MLFIQPTVKAMENTQWGIGCIIFQYNSQQSSPLHFSVECCQAFLLKSSLSASLLPCRDIYHKQFQREEQ